MTAFIVDGDKGGVGKSFVARALADFFLVSKTEGKIVVFDCDPSNADVVCDGGIESERIGEVEIDARRTPVMSQEDWFNTVDVACKILQPGATNIDFIFSLPAGAGLYIDDTVLSMFSMLDPLTVWVLPESASSHQIILLSY